MNDPRLDDLRVALYQTYVLAKAVARANQNLADTITVAENSIVAGDLAKTQQFSADVAKLRRDFDHINSLANGMCINALRVVRRVEATGTEVRS